MPTPSEILAQEIDTAFRQGLRSNPRMNLPDWADTYRRLSASSSALAGKWRTESVEVARGPMMAVTERGVKVISCKIATQTLKTELLLNTIGYFAHLDPSPMMIVHPKDEAVKKFSKERLAPMARETPVLQSLLGDLRTRRGEDTLGYKEFPGGFLAIESAGSPTNLAARAIRIAFADEIDKFETTKEGDPMMLIPERLATFRNSLLIATCSPTLEDRSRIDKLYHEGDQRRAFIACPHCKHEQILEFFKYKVGAYVDWAKSGEGEHVEHFPMTAAIYCESCGSEWSESQRMQILKTKHAIKWKQTRPFVCCEVRQEPLITRRWIWDDTNQVGYACCAECGARGVSNKHASFTASKLYSPFITITDLAAKWLLAKDHPESKQTFYNTNLALVFKSEVSHKVEPHSLSARREKYMATVPAGVLMITAGVDVQSGSHVNEGRLEVEVVGWGLGEESWSIEHKVFMGDPAKPDVWAALDAYLLQGFKHELGFEMAIRSTCIDSGGHNTEEVYKFCRARIGRKVWAVKGAADRGGQRSPGWPVPKLDEPRKTRLSGYRPVILGVSSIKEAVRNRLAVVAPGPGYCHFHVDVPEARFEQLTSEDFRIETKDGFRSGRWVLPRGRANEALDCRVYAYGALLGWYAHGGKLERVAQQIQTIVKPTTGVKPDVDNKPTGVKSDVDNAPAIVTPKKPYQAPPAPRTRPSPWMA